VFILTKVLVSAWPSPAPCEAVTGPTEDKEEEALSETAQVNVQALRALRVVFSLERNRRSFKRIFPPSIFERFIEIGQYQRQASIKGYCNCCMLLHAYSCTPSLARLVLQVHSYAPTLTRLLLHAYSYTLTFTRLRQASKYHALAMQLARLPADKQGFMRKAVHDMRADLDSDRHVHAYSYTPTLACLLLHAYSYTPTLTRLLLHAYCIAGACATICSSENPSAKALSERSGAPEWLGGGAQTVPFTIL
jgi:hypothetical protein